MRSYTHTLDQNQNSSAIFGLQCDQTNNSSNSNDNSSSNNNNNNNNRSNSKSNSNTNRTLNLVSRSILTYGYPIYIYI